MLAQERLYVPGPCMSGEGEPEWPHVWSAAWQKATEYEQKLPI